MSKPHFICTKCGACCMQLELFGPMYQHLDRGDGVCMHFDVKTRLCKIYDKRPLICRVEEGYSIFFKEISYEEYLAKTYAGCEILKTKIKEKEGGIAP